MANLQITVEDVTRAAIADALPLEGDAARWGDELYFSVPVDVSTETAREAVPTDAVAYWPQGKALCLFWGPTREHRRPTAGLLPVNLVADIDSTSPLAAINGGGHIHSSDGGSRLHYRLEVRS